MGASRDRRLSGDSYMRETCLLSDPRKSERSFTWGDTASPSRSSNSDHQALNIVTRAGVVVNAILSGGASRFSDDKMTERVRRDSCFFSTETSVCCATVAIKSRNCLRRSALETLPASGPSSSPSECHSASRGNIYKENLVVHVDGGRDGRTGRDSVTDLSVALRASISIKFAAILALRSLRSASLRLSAVSSCTRRS